MPEPVVRHPRGILAKIPGDVEALVYVNKVPFGKEVPQVMLLVREILDRCGTRIRRIAVGDNRQGGLFGAFLSQAQAREA